MPTKVEIPIPFRKRLKPLAKLRVAEHVILYSKGEGYFLKPTNEFVGYDVKFSYGAQEFVNKIA